MYTVNLQFADFIRHSLKKTVCSDPGVDSDGIDESDGLDEDRMHPPFHSLPSRPLPDQDLEILARDPSYEDIFVSYATIPTYVAYRNNMKGSW